MGPSAAPRQDTTAAPQSHPSAVTNHAASRPTPRAHGRQRSLALLETRTTSMNIEPQRLPELPAVIASRRRDLPIDRTLSLLVLIAAVMCRTSSSSPRAHGGREADSIAQPASPSSAALSSFPSQRSHPTPRVLQRSQTDLCTQDAWNPELSPGRARIPVLELLGFLPMDGRVVCRQTPQNSS